MATTKIIPPPGTFTTTEKLYPVCELNPPADPDAPYCKTRAEIPMEGWIAALNSVKDLDWEKYAKEKNVTLIRPAHDAWGINKIIFTFCDDFMAKIIDLPLSEDPLWKPLLEQVYNAVGVPKERIIRALLARMPAGVSIPPHHDTGYWVKHTHRLHLPVETSDLINFNAGATKETMKTYLFNVGRIVELNNQAEHSVENNMKEGYRTHLIFDYIDEEYLSLLPSRTLLNVGDTVYQTRRSIDLHSEVKNYNYKENSVKYMIIGAQKSGTTSMYEYITQHPLVLKVKNRETHYFDWNFLKKYDINDKENHLNVYLSNFFEEKVLRFHPSLCSGESTPSYMLYSHLFLPRIKSILPKIKLIVMLRNPVDRAYSQYKMITDPVGTKEQLALRGHSNMLSKTFEEVVFEEMSMLAKYKVNCNSTYEDLKKNILDKDLVPMNHGGHSLLLRGLYCLLLEPFMDANIWPQDQLLILSIADIKKDKKKSDDENKLQHISEDKVNKTMQKVFNYLSLPPHDIEDSSAKNTREYKDSDPLSPHTRQILEKFFEPFNQRLFKMLGREITDW